MLSSGWILIAMAAAVLVLVLWVLRRSLSDDGNQEHASLQAEGQPERDGHRHGGHGCC